jgi:O-antigen/teichoic acid export membrane protein
MKLLRDARLMSAAALIGVGMAALRSLLILRILGPETIGVWKTVMVIYLAGDILRLGVSKGMGMRVPQWLGQGREDEARRDALAAGTWVLIAGLGFAALLTAVSFVVPSPEYQLAFRLMALVMFCAQPHQYLRELASANQRFALRSQELLLAGAIDLALGLMLSAWLGLLGVGLGTAFAITLPAFFLWKRQPDAFAFAFDAKRILELIRAGAPFSLADSSFALLRFTDLLLITPLLGAAMAGYYSVSLLINEFSMFIAIYGVNQVVGPHLLREFGRTGCLRAASALYETPLRIFACGLPPLLAIGMLLLDPCVRLILPQYERGIEAAEVTLWGILFLCIHMTVNPAFQAARQFRTLFQLFAVMIFAAGAAQWCVIRSGGGLREIAWTSVALLGAFAVSELALARRAAGHSGMEIIAFAGGLIAPVAIVMAVMQASADWPLAGRLALLIGAYVPLLFLYESRFAIFKTVRQPA